MGGGGDGEPDGGGASKADGGDGEGEAEGGGGGGAGGGFIYIPGGGLLTGFAMRSDPKNFSDFTNPLTLGTTRTARHGVSHTSPRHCILLAPRLCSRRRRPQPTPTPKCAPLPSHRTPRPFGGAGRWTASPCRWGVALRRLVCRRARRDAVQE